MSLLLDASTPLRVAGTSNPATTAAFSPPASSLLFALCSGDSSTTFAVAGGGLAWQPIGFFNNGSTCAVGAFWAWNAYARSGITVASTKTGSFTANQLKVLVFTGAEPIFGGAFGGAAALTKSLTTTRERSWVWAIAGSEAGSTGQTGASGCTINDTFTAFGGVSGGTVKTTATTPAVGTAVTIGVAGSTTPSIFAFEVREAVPTPWPLRSDRPAKRVRFY